jgi:uncharacterized membrane-anchored protein YjiN (DUF445 family)
MRITLELQEDEDLRKAVRQAVMGEITGWAREEVDKLVLERLGEAVDSKLPSQDSIRRMIENVLSKQVASKIDNVLSQYPAFASRERAREQVREIVIDVLKSWVKEDLSIS